MRDLTQEEINLALDDNGEQEEGCIAIEATILELAQNNTGTSCGIMGNDAFNAIKDLLSNPCLVRGWYDPKENTMCGMIHIQCDSMELAERISEVAYELGNGGSLRPSGQSLWKTFFEFENE